MGGRPGNPPIACAAIAGSRMDTRRWCMAHGLLPCWGPDVDMRMGTWPEGYPRHGKRPRALCAWPEGRDCPTARVGVDTRMGCIAGCRVRRAQEHGADTRMGYIATPLDNINLTKVTPCPIHRHRGTLGEPMRTAAGTFSPFFLFISGCNPFMGMKGILPHPACA